MSTFTASPEIKVGTWHMISKTCFTIFTHVSLETCLKTAFRDSDHDVAGAEPAEPQAGELEGHLAKPFDTTSEAWKARG